MKPASCAPVTLRARAALSERSTGEGQDDDRVAIRLRTRFPISDAGQPNAGQSGVIAFAHAIVMHGSLSQREDRRALGPHPRTNGGRTRRWRMDTGS